MSSSFKTTTRTLPLVLCAVLGLQASCGTLLHPERRGQRSGNIDGGIAVLDSLLLLLFIVPGVVALVIDFGNGTIYEPGGKR